MDLQQILERETRLADFLDRVEAIETEDPTLIKRKRKIREYMERLAPEIYSRPELFVPVMNISISRLKIAEKKKIASEAFADRQYPAFLKEVAYFLAQFRSNRGKYDDPDFVSLLNAGNQIMLDQASAIVPSDETLSCPVRRIVYLGDRTLKQLRERVPSYMDDIIQFLTFVGGSDPCSIAHFFEDMPTNIDQAIEHGYQEQLEIFLGTMGSMGRNAFALRDIFGSPGMEGNVLVENCKRLEEIGKLDYYGKVMERLKPTLKRRPGNARLLCTCLPKLIELYESHGLGDQFFETLDFVLNVQGKAEPDRDALPTKYIADIDIALEFFRAYPLINPKARDKIKELLPKMYQATNGHTRFDWLMDVVDTFLSRKLDRTVSFDDWMDYLSRGFPKLVVAYTAEYLIKDSIQVIENGIDLKVYERFLVNITPRLFYRSKQLKKALESNISDDEKRRFIDYYSILKDVPGLPEFECDESWLEAIAGKFKLDYPEFKDWIDTTRARLEAVRTKYNDTDENILIAQQMFGYHASKTMDDYYKIHNYLNSIPPLVKSGIDLRKALELFQYLPYRKGEPPLTGLKEVINSDSSIEDKKRFIRYYGVLGKIKGVPPCSPDDEWLSEVAAFFKADRSKITEWLDNVLSKEYFEWNHDRDDYTSALPNMITKGIDFIEALRLHEYITFGEYHNTTLLLKKIINSDEPLEKKVEFLKKTRSHHSLLTTLPPENLDFDSWFAAAQKAQKSYFKSKGINLKYSPDFVSLLLSNTIDPRAREDLLTLARLEEQGRVQKNRFVLGKVYGRYEFSDLRDNMDAFEATKLLLYGLISREPTRVNAAQKYFSADKILKARSYVERSTVKPTRLYAMLRSDISQLASDLQPHEQRWVSQRIINKITEIYLSSSSESEGKKELRELVTLVQLIHSDAELFNAVVAKMQDGTLYDLRDGRRLMCCAMMSQDRERTEIESLYYALDPNIAVMQVAPERRGTYGNPIGAAILANAVNNGNDDVLLVDSVEGGHIFQNLDPETSFDLVNSGIVGAAVDADSPYVFFNVKAPNIMPKRFTSQLRDVLGLGTPEETELTKVNGIQATSRERRYLEAFSDRLRLSGPVTGYLVQTERLVAIK